VTEPRGEAVYPPSLQPGDTIGIFSPAGPVRDQNKIDNSLRLFRDAGYKLLVTEQTLSPVDYLAASDEERAAELMRLWADPSIRALVALRGGYGCLRMIDLLDWKFMARHPKMVIGFSDLTVLLNTLYSHGGLVGIHGPVLSTLATSSEQSVESFFSLLNGKIPSYEIGDQIELLRGGNARGTVLGGNLTTLVHMLSTPWEINWDGSILVLEDTGEDMYRIDRMLTQLYLGGKLDRLGGLILGDFDRGNGSNQELNKDLAVRVGSRVLELTKELDFPVWTGFPLGHGIDNLPLLIGMKGIMNSTNRFFGYCQTI